MFHPAYADDNYVADLEVRTVYNVPDRLEEDPEIIRAEGMFYNTERTQEWSPYVYDALLNIQNQCYGDYVALCYEDYVEEQEMMTPFSLASVFPSDFMNVEIETYFTIFFDLISEVGDDVEEVGRRLTDTSKAKNGAEFIDSLRSIYTRSYGLRAGARKTTSTASTSTPASKVKMSLPKTAPMTVTSTKHFSTSKKLAEVSPHHNHIITTSQPTHNHIITTLYPHHNQHTTIS